LLTQKIVGVSLEILFGWLHKNNVPLMPI
jgi:hypothetical protein